MFNFRNVRESVTARLHIIGRVDEAVMHELYAKAIAEELVRSKNAVLVLRTRMQKVKARHPEKGWTMIDRIEWNEIASEVDELAASYG